MDVDHCPKLLTCIYKHCLLRKSEDEATKTISTKKLNSPEGDIQTLTGIPFTYRIKPELTRVRVREMKKKWSDFRGKKSSHQFTEGSITMTYGRGYL